MKCSLTLHQIDKYTVQVWPTIESAESVADKRARLAQDRARVLAFVGSAASVRTLEEFEAILDEMRKVMDE